MADVDEATAPTLTTIPQATLTRVSSPAVESVVLQWLLAALSTAEAETVASLHQLNTEAVCALARSETSWFREHLIDDFVCTLADGRRLDRGGFLRQLSERRPIENFACDEVDVRPLGELGIVHGVVHSDHGGSPTSTRFTHVWLVRDGRWQLVAAHLSHVAA
jgi:Domain of unknown function (DUF4440)